jgi:hypothetical protein
MGPPPQSFLLTFPTTTMQSVLFLAALALGAAAQDLTINTPTVGGVAGAAECQPLLLGWSGGTPPYIVTVDTQPAGATHVVEFDNQSSTSVTWPNVNATVGTQLLLTIKDTTGLSKNSAPFPVTAGSGDGCLAAGGGSSPGSSGGSAPPVSTPASGGGTTPTSGSAPGTTPSGTSPGSSGGSGGSGNTSKSGSPSSSSSGKPSTTPGAAMALQAPAGVVPAFAAITLAGLVALLA